MPENKQEKNESGHESQNAKVSNSSQTEQKTINKAVWTTRVVLLLAALFFVWYIYSDRLTPYTTQGQVTEIIIPVVPMVSGYLIETHVKPTPL